MTLAKSVRYALRTVSVLVVAGIVIIAAYAMTPRYDPSREEAEQAKIEAAQAELAKKHSAELGSEDALRRAIDEVRSGVPNYDRINKARSRLLASLGSLQRMVIEATGGIPVRTNKELSDAAQQQKLLLASLGPMQSAKYLGPSPRGDRYRVTFKNGSLLWGISVGKGGVIEDYWFVDNRPSTRQEWIDNYADFTLRERVTRMATQFLILLAAAVFGRLALRIRL